jgi:hypothetical protein
MNSRSKHYYYYACDAAQLLETCLGHLQTVLELDANDNHGANRDSLVSLQAALNKTEQLLQHFFLEILPPPSAASAAAEESLPSLAGCVTDLRRVMEEEKRQSTRSSNPPQHPPARSTHRRVTDTLLFRLIVALQLCLVRIDDAHLVVAGVRTCPPETLLATTVDGSIVVLWIRRWCHGFSVAAARQSKGILADSSKGGNGRLSLFSTRPTMEGRLDDYKVGKK